jgi:hypothetical protein
VSNITVLAEGLVDTGVVVLIDDTVNACSMVAIEGMKKISMEVVKKDE